MTEKRNKRIGKWTWERPEPTTNPPEIRPVGNREKELKMIRETPTRLGVWNAWEYAFIKFDVYIKQSGGRHIKQSEVIEAVQFAQALEALHNKAEEHEALSSVCLL